MSGLIVATSPVVNRTSYSQTITLEGATFGLQFDFNQRCCSWYMHLADANGVDIYNGVKLVCGMFLLGSRCKDPRRPAGDFFCLSSTTDASPPGLLDLLPATGRCTLMYVTSDWVAAMVAGNHAELLAQLAANVTSSGASTYGTE
jgi:hypothetical protein